MENFGAKIEKLFVPKNFKFEGKKEVGDIESVSWMEMHRITGKGGVMPENGLAEKVAIVKEVSGNLELFEFLAKNSSLPATHSFFPSVHHSKMYMVYVRYETNITNSTHVQTSIKQESDKCLEDTEKHFERINQNINDYVSKEFRPAISKAIADELIRRNAKEDARHAMM
ncbi:MAG: hypothetical protein IPJ79_05260 [Bacteroidetes bacterium]|nr:hypothetical protein [Bacteroidota bacterium]